jgi:hypothetical protein
VADRGVGGAWRRAAMTPVLGATDGATGSPGLGTLFLALLVGLAIVGLLLLAMTVRSRQHGPGIFTVVADLVRLEVLALRERKLPDDDRRRPEAELDRRFAAGWCDLKASLTGGLGSRASAEIAAHDEQVARAAEKERAALLEKARVAKSRAAERRSRAAQQAELFAAQGRLLRDNNAMSLRDAWGRGPARGLTADPAADAAMTSAMLEATRLLAAQQAAVEAATERRVAAERAADEAAARVRLEKEAAEVAHRARAVAERAAAKAKAVANRERLTAGKASSARVQAEAAARRAADRAAKERAVAKAAASRRQAAVTEAARAEAAQRDAMTRELTARRAAEAAEASRRAMVASVEERQSAVAAGQPPDEIDLRGVIEPAIRSEARTAAATETRPRRLHVVRRAHDTDPGSSPPPHDTPPAAAAREPELAAVRGTADPQPSAGSTVPQMPALATEGAAAASARVPGSGDRKVHVVRLVAALLVPAVVVLRTVAQGRWWTDAGPLGWSMLALAGLLTLLGLGWLWAATGEPHALLPRTRRALAAAEQRHQAHVAAAAALLAELQSGGPSTEEIWARFEAQTGLTVPSATRTVIDPGMDPGALVRHLAARQRQGPTRAQSLAVVTLVPLLTCLVPASVLLLLV